jgi:hypothetical protein
MKDMIVKFYSTDDKYKVNFGHKGEFGWYLTCSFIIALLCRLFFGFVGIDDLANLFNWLLIVTLIYPAYSLLGYIISSDFSFKNKLHDNLKLFCKQNGFLEYMKEEQVVKDSNGRERYKYVDKLIYSPDVTYQFNSEFLTVIFRIDGHKYSNKYSDLGDSLSNMLVLPLVGKEVKRGYVVYTFRRSEVERKSVSDVFVNEFSDEIELNDSYSWNFRKCPHALITGITGSGKTFLFAYFILVFLKINANFRVVDPKRGDLYFLRKYFGDDSVVYSKNHALRILRESCELIDERMEYMPKQKNYKWGEDYSYYNLSPFFIIFDEAAAFVALLSKKEKDEYDSYLSKIVLEGRQAGVFMMFAMQRPDGDFIKTALRDQLGLRIALGSNSNSGYKMVYGDVGKDLILNDKSGGFYMDLKMHTPQEFFTPYLDIDFISEIEDEIGYIDVDLDKED